MTDTPKPRKPRIVQAKPYRVHDDAGEFIGYAIATTPKRACALLAPPPPRLSATPLSAADAATIDPAEFVTETTPDE